MTIDFNINPQIDPKTLRTAFKKKKRLHIPRILTGEAAEALYNEISNNTDWELAFNEGEKTYALNQDHLKALPPKKIRDLRRAILDQAAAGFQFMYNRYNIYEDYKDQKNPSNLLHRFHEFLNSRRFLSFIQDLTGEEEIRFVDSQATAYGPGHFLTLHSDKVRGEDRQFAYVFNFTKRWQSDWGGILKFLGEDGHLDQGFVPTYNALNLFEVPQMHTVSYVAPYAKKIRYAITGWIRKSDSHLPRN